MATRVEEQLTAEVVNELVDVLDPEERETRGLLRGEP